MFLLLTQANITEYIGNIADTAVSAYPSINPTDISSIYFNFPDIQIQKSFLIYGLIMILKSNLTVR